jgi:hypothetical protein
MRYVILTLLILPAFGEIVEITPRRTRDYDERANQGWCSIRVWVDDEVNIFVESSRVIFETVRGRAARDAGSECSQPLPLGNALSDFQFRGIDGRGEVRLIEDPGPRNRYRVWVRIRDRKSGGEEHHFKLNWKNTWTQYGSARAASGSRRDSGSRAGDRSDRDASGRYFDQADRTWRLDGNGVCFYLERDFRGDAFCSRLGDNRPNMGRVVTGTHQSFRIFGNVREVEVFDQEDFRGSSARLTRDERDLSRVRNSRGDTLAGRVQSFRMR